ncbi:MAG TPA: class I SAM-dependent methyltransferase [Opitutaceae bacterium]|nr:class I SAM-dependent methyltransferase [Opitutaceae bacterium]
MSLASGLSPEYRFAPAPVLPRLCTSAINRLDDFRWERRLGVRTTGGAAVERDDAHDYGYLAYHTYFAVLDALRLTPEDVVADLGCGKGRVVCIAAQYRVREVIGVEIDPALCVQAAINVARLRHRRTPVQFACQSAVDFDFDPVTAIVMFHPFGAATLNAVLARLHNSLARRPRRFQVAYCNPLLSPLLAAKPWLRLGACWRPASWSRLKFPVHFYSAGHG